MTNSADPDRLGSPDQWFLQKPTDLALHCLLRQGMSYSAREGSRVIPLRIMSNTEIRNDLAPSSMLH